MYVVGFMGFDGALGRTYLCDSMLKVKLRMLDFIEENMDSPPDDGYWDEHSSYKVDDGHYFCGSLET